jgi:hypothetical protein
VRTHLSKYCQIADKVGSGGFIASTNEQPQDILISSEIGCGPRLLSDKTKIALSQTPEPGAQENHKLSCYRFVGNVIRADQIYIQFGYAGNL